MIKKFFCLNYDCHDNPMRNNYLQNQINSSEVSKDNVCQHIHIIDWWHNVNLMSWRLHGKGWKDMGLLFQDVKFYIFHNGHKSISYNIMWGHPLPTMIVAKKVDPHKVQMLVINVVSPQGLKDGKESI
jgi:hypothetical protein